MMNVSIFDAFLAGAVSTLSPQGVGFIFLFICFLSAALNLRIITEAPQQVTKPYALTYGFIFFLAYGVSFLVTLNYWSWVTEGFDGKTLAIGMIGTKMLLMLIIAVLSFWMLKSFWVGNAVSKPFWLTPLSLALMILVGVVLQLTSSPVVGPVLGRILANAALDPNSYMDEIISANVLLIFYLLGFSAIGLVVSLTLGKLWKTLALSPKVFVIINGLFNWFLVIGAVLIIQ